MSSDWSSEPCGDQNEFQAEEPEADGDTNLHFHIFSMTMSHFRVSMLMGMHFKVSYIITPQKNRAPNYNTANDTVRVETPCNTVQLQCDELQGLHFNFEQGKKKKPHR